MSANLTLNQTSLSKLPSQCVVEHRSAQYVGSAGQRRAGCQERRVSWPVVKRPGPYRQAQCKHWSNNQVSVRALTRQTEWIGHGVIPRRSPGESSSAPTACCPVRERCGQIPLSSAEACSCHKSVLGRDNLIKSSMPSPPAGWVVSTRTIVQVQMSYFYEIPSCFCIDWYLKISGFIVTDHWKFEESGIFWN